MQRSIFRKAVEVREVHGVTFTPKDLQLKKERRYKRTRDSIVSRIHQLVTGEPVKWSAVPPPLPRADIRFTATLRK